MDTDNEDVEFMECSRSFMQWLRSCDKVRISPKIELADLRSTGAGRGVVALEEIKEGEELFFIPHSAIMSAQNSNITEQLPEILGLPAWTQIILVLIYEWSRGEASPWHNYWKVLPMSFNTLLYWSESELKELEGSAVLRKLGREQITEFVRNQAMPLVQSHPSLFEIDKASSNQGLEELLTSLVTRMGTLVLAYGFDREREEGVEGDDENGFVVVNEDHPSMIPLADMLNADGQRRNNARLEQDEVGVSMVATKPIAKGNECLNDYGEYPRSDLLRRYGYVSEEYRAHDVVEISLRQMAKFVPSACGISISDAGIEQEPDCSELTDRLNRILQRTEIFEDCQVLDDSYDIPSMYSKGEENVQYFEPALILTVELLAADERERKALWKVKQPPTQLMTSKASKLLLAVLEDRLKEYPTTIAADKDILKQKDRLPVRYRQAIEVRLGEKEILARAIESLKVRSTDGMEDAREGNKSKKRKH